MRLAPFHGEEPDAFAGPEVILPGRPGYVDPREELRKHREKTDIAQWRRFAAHDVKKSRARHFESSVIRPFVRHWIEKALAEGDFEKAFANPKRQHVKRIDTSARATAAISAGVPIFESYLRRMADNYIAQAIAVTKAKKVKPHKATQADVNEIGSWVGTAYEAGGEDAVELVSGSYAGAVEFAKARAAELVTSIGEDLRDKTNAMVTQAVAEGQSIGGLRAELNSLYSDDAIKGRALMIARTETAKAYNTGTVAAYREAGVGKVTVMDGDSEASCDDCKEVDGDIWSLERAELEPTEHPNCVRGFAPVVFEGEMAA
jgi:SPP1 gp7 family putative phage head morphogenesis protein